jgi:micrococcal nuclease
MIILYSIQSNKQAICDVEGLLMHRTITCLLTFLFFSCSIDSHALTWQGKVVGVSDGDTITVMHDGKSEKIRLYGVDCPEKAQDFGQKAKRFSSDMVFGKTVDVESVVTEKDGRTIGIVRTEDKCLSEELIRNGLGWVYTRYCDKAFCSQWKQLEQKAKSAKTGLWSKTDPTPPWDFRRATKSSKADTPISSGDRLLLCESEVVCLPCCNLQLI